MARAHVRPPWLLPQRRALAQLGSAMGPAVRKRRQGRGEAAGRRHRQAWWSSACMMQRRQGSPKLLPLRGGQLVQRAPDRQERRIGHRQGRAQHKEQQEERQERRHQARLQQQHRRSKLLAVEHQLPR